MIPFRENLNGSILLKLSVIDGTYSLSEKKTVAIAILKYAEHSTPMRDEIVNALAFLGIDKGNIYHHLNGKKYKKGIKGHILKWEHDL